MIVKLRYGLVAALVGAALLGGCGADDEEDAPAPETTTEERPSEEGAVVSEYGDEVNAVLEPLSMELQQTGTETRPQAVADGLTNAVETLDAGADDLGAIEPPEGFEEPHDRLVGAFQSFGDAAADAREATESGDTEAVVADYAEAATEFQTEITETVQGFEDAGLDIGSQSSP